MDQRIGAFQILSTPTWICSTFLLWTHFQCRSFTMLEFLLVCVCRSQIDAILLWHWYSNITWDSNFVKAYFLRSSTVKKCSMTAIKYLGRKIIRKRTFFIVKENFFGAFCFAFAENVFMVDSLKYNRWTN